MWSFGKITNMLNFRKDCGMGSISAAFSGPVSERPTRAAGGTKWPTRGCLVHLKFLSMKELGSSENEYIGSSLSQTLLPVVSDRKPL